MYFNKKAYRIVKEAKIKKANKFFYKMARGYDSYGFMSKKLGEELNGLFEDDYIIGIHRTGYTVINDSVLNDMFNNGIINNADAMLGVWQDEDVFLDKTFTFFEDFIVMYGQVKSACNYKNSQGVIIAKLPKSYLGLSDGEVKPIYFEDETGIKRLLPEFIYGYVPVKNGVCGEIVRNYNYKNEHDYENDGLRFDGSVSSSLRVK